MIDVESIMYTTTKYMVQKQYPKAVVVDAAPSSTPTAFPCALVQMMDNPVTSTDLENTEAAVTASFQCELYMNGSGAKSQSKKIEAIINDVFAQKGFRRVYGWARVDNATDTNVLRRLARYQRVIGSGDTI